MGKRTDLHEILCDILGSRYVYFQQPEDGRLKYPCIIYKIKNDDLLYADNYPYKTDRCYRLTLITDDPDTELPFKLERLPMIRMIAEPYSADNLYHFVYQIYY